MKIIDGVAYPEKLGEIFTTDQGLTVIVRKYKGGYCKEKCVFHPSCHFVLGKQSPFSYKGAYISCKRRLLEPEHFGVYFEQFNLSHHLKEFEI